MSTHLPTYGESRNAAKSQIYTLHALFNLDAISDSSNLPPFKSYRHISFVAQKPPLKSLISPAVGDASDEKQPVMEDFESIKTLSIDYESEDLRELLRLRKCICFEFLQTANLPYANAQRLCSSSVKEFRANTHTGDIYLRVHVQGTKIFGAPTLSLNLPIIEKHGKPMAKFLGGFGSGSKQSIKAVGNTAYHLKVGYNDEDFIKSYAYGTNMKILTIQGDPVSFTIVHDGESHSHQNLTSSKPEDIVYVNFNFTEAESLEKVKKWLTQKTFFKNGDSLYIEKRIRCPQGSSIKPKKKKGDPYFSDSFYANLNFSDITFSVQCATDFYCGSRLSECEQLQRAQGS